MSVRRCPPVLHELMSASASRSSVCLLVDARTSVHGPTSAAAADTVNDTNTVSAAVWYRLLPFVHCQALLAVTEPQRTTEWSVLAIHDRGDEGGHTHTAHQQPHVSDWLVRQPLQVGSLRALRQRCSGPLTATTPLKQAMPASVPAPAAHLAEPSDGTPTNVLTGIDPVLAALKAVMLREVDLRCESQSAHHCQPPQQSSQYPCHLVLLSPHLFSSCFVRDSALFTQSLSTLGCQLGFSFRLLHMRCCHEQLAPSLPLLQSLQGAPYIRASARSDGVTSSACQQVQQVWSIAASLAALEPVHATLLFGRVEQQQDGGEWLDSEANAETATGSDSDTWHGSFHDQSDVSANELHASGHCSALSIPVLLFSAVRTLPLPVNTQVRRQHTVRAVTEQSVLCACLLTLCADVHMLPCPPVMSRSCLSRTGGASSRA